MVNRQEASGAVGLFHARRLDHGGIVADLESRLLADTVHLVTEADDALPEGDPADPAVRERLLESLGRLAAVDDGPADPEDELHAAAIEDLRAGRIPARAIGALIRSETAIPDTCTPAQFAVSLTADWLCRRHAAVTDPTTRPEPAGEDGGTGRPGAHGGGTGEEAGRLDQRQWIDDMVALAVSGDRRARDQLLAEVHPLVLKYCRARLGRQESLMGSAEDVAQDVCMAVVTALPNYVIKGLSFRAFVYGIAAHKVTDAFRAIGRNRAEPVAVLPDGPVTEDGPEHRLLSAEMSARLGRILGQLSARQREVLVLRVAVGLSAEETAQAVRSTPGAVRVTQHRALGKLRKILLGASAARTIGAKELLDKPEDGAAEHDEAATERAIARIRDTLFAPDADDCTDD